MPQPSLSPQYVTVGYGVARATGEGTPKRIAFRKSGDKPSAWRFRRLGIQVGRHSSEWRYRRRQYARACLFGPDGVDRRKSPRQDCSLVVFVTSPIAASLLAVGVLCVIVALLPAIRSKRDQVFVEDD